MLLLGVLLSRGLGSLHWRTLDPAESKSLVHSALHGQENVNWVIKAAVKRDEREGSQRCKLEAPPSEVDGLAELVEAAWKAEGANVRRLEGFHGLTVSGDHPPDWWKPGKLRDEVTLTIGLSGNAEGYVLVISSAEGTILIYAWTT